MNGRGKSDSLIVPVKLSNKDGGALASAEEVEGRRLAKGNGYGRQRKGIRVLGSRRFGITFTKRIVFGRHIFV
jgi:hypothetical protein